jgi:hypothetical protein
VICSQLYSDSYSSVTGQLLTRTVADTITPAALSASPAFGDVDIAWATIPGLLCLFGSEYFLDLGQMIDFVLVGNSDVRAESQPQREFGELHFFQPVRY